MSENALALIEGKTELVFTTPDGLNPLINAVREQVKGVIHDISTKKGRDACISLSVMVRDTKTELERRKLSLTEEMRSKITLINTEGKRAWTELEKIQKEVRQPVTDWEEIEEKRVKAHEVAIDSIKLRAVDIARNWQHELISNMQDAMKEAQSLRNHDWQEFSLRAHEVINQAVDSITETLIKRDKYDSEQAELIRLRAEKEERDRLDRERRIAEEAAAMAKREAEEKAHREATVEAARVKAEQEKIARERAEIDAKAKADAERAEQERLRIEHERQEAEDRAKKAEEDRIASEERAATAAKKAESDRIAAEKKAEIDKEIAVQTERDRVAAEEKRVADEATKREADKAHRTKINNEALHGIRKAIAGIEADSDSIGKVIIAAIAKGEIQHVKIVY